MPDAASDRYTRIWIYLFPISVLVLGVLLRIFQIDYDFDGDEISSVDLASRPLMKIVNEWPHVGHPPLHVVLLHLWMNIFGTSETAARSMSVVFSIIFLGVSYRLLRELKVRKWVTTLSLLIICGSPYFVYLGQQARPFSLLLMMTAINIMAFARATRPSHSTLVAWTLSNILLVYTQYFTLYIVVLETLVLMYLLPNNRWRVCALGFFPVLLILPWILVVIVPSLVPSGSGLTTISWITPPTLFNFVWFYVAIFGEGSDLFRARWLVLVLAIILCIGAWGVVKQRQVSFQLATLIAIAFGLPLVIFGLSQMTPTSFWASRHLASAAFAFVLVIGLFLERVPKTAAVFLASILVVWTMSSIPQAFPKNTKPPWRAIANFIETNHAQSIALANEKWVQESLNFYRLDGPVLMIEDNRVAATTESFLLVCRTMFCDTKDSIDPSFQKSLVRTFRWGLSDNRYPTVEIYLFERVAPGNQEAGA